jgi:hypothetical protein
MTYLAAAIVEIAENPDRTALRELRIIAAQVARMERVLDEIVGNAAADEKAIQRSIKCPTV